jgi:hypothetical protein
LTQDETACGRVDAVRMGGRKEGFGPFFPKDDINEGAPLRSSSGGLIWDVSLFCGVGQAKRRWKGREKLSEEQRVPQNWSGGAILSKA